MHNIVYVATENDSVYAFDADGLSTTPPWQVGFLDPPTIVPQPCTTANIGCVITPNVGITGTPVIDPNTQTLYVVSTTQENGTVFQRLHALDLTTGAENFGGPSDSDERAWNRSGQPEGHRELPRALAPER